MISFLSLIREVLFSTRRRDVCFRSLDPLEVFSSKSLLCHLLDPSHTSRPVFLYLVED